MRAVTRLGALRSFAGAMAVVLWGFAGGAQADEPTGYARGKALFTTVKPACAVCHTLQAAGAEGQVGPALDELKPEAERVLRVLRNGFGVMPSYEGQISEEDMRALATFVSHSTGGAPLPERR